ncbi:MAG: radical SAM protein [Desulfobulbaceae bacterium]|nr:radical SAM protein [Desulfobulbaceae bacterium]
METANWQHLEIKDSDPSQWLLDKAKENVLLVALNMPGYYSLPVRILSLLAGQSDELGSRFNVRYMENSIREPTDRLLAVITSMHPGIIGFSVNIWNRQLVIELAAAIKKILPGVTLLAGGQEVTNSVTNPLLALPGFDYIIDGEGEIPFGQFLRQWDKDANTLAEPARVSGLHYYTPGAQPAFTGPAEIVAGLDEVPSVILAGLIDPRLCAKKLGVMIEGARGCPFRCGYCFEGGYNRKVRSAPMERVIAEMEYMVDKGAGYFHLMDPILCNSNPRRLKEISEFFTALRQSRKGAVILVEAYAQHITEEIAGHLKQGFIIDIGLQTINEQTNEAITRPFDRERFREGITYLHKTGASFNIYLICGLPHETMESFFRGILFALEQNPTKIFFNELQLLNGTALRKKALDFNYTFNPVPQYEVHATPWMNKRSMQITLTAARTLGRYYNLNGRSIYAAAPWYASPHGVSHEEIVLDLASPCAHGCPGCVQGDVRASRPEEWRKLEKAKGKLAGKDVRMRVGNQVDDKPLLRFSGKMPLASVLRTGIHAPADFFDNPRRVDSLFQSGAWHYTTFLTAPPARDPRAAARFDRKLAALESLNRTLPLPGAAVLEPHLDIRLLTGKADPDGYLLAIEKITARRPTVISVPRELDHAGKKWQAALARGFDICISRGHWLRLPAKQMRHALAEEYSDEVITCLGKMNLISADDNQPVCYVAGERLQGA